jgi:hypothetical protein
MARRYSLHPGKAKGEEAMTHRRRYKQTKPLQNRLSDFLAESRERADEAPDGIEREKMIKNRGPKRQQELTHGRTRQKCSGRSKGDASPEL